MESQKGSRSLEIVKGRVAKVLGLTPETAEVLLRRAQSRMSGGTSLNFTGEFDPSKTQPLDVAETG
ncbi:MAG: hypothetical protein UY97_C0004G0037 [Parcubacteria group bacterium GW2011_GWB1_57_6]|nr:MAG: hypothetical protein UY93_C0002G0472 [Parcubacteria group bacterium GW2011_GWA1_56_13]KKW46648.1 MAG: hypothetical protein UY97_C0004G0037 [Parcubacteria group bacterium GW2011_GWB1_57_6]